MLSLCFNVNSQTFPHYKQLPYENLAAKRVKLKRLKMAKAFGLQVHRNALQTAKKDSWMSVSWNTIVGITNPSRSLKQ